MILIVDDNQENIFSLKSLLKLHQFEIDTASSGEEALKKILQNDYTIILLDVQMPEMDGFEVAEAISGYSKSKDIPIIFLSAVNTHKKFITKGYAAGGIDYVTKPFDPDILLLKIKTFHRLSEQTRQLQAMEKDLRKEIELRKQAESILEKKVEERTSELKNSNRKLQESNKELQQFAFVASHDLQEPLRKIQTFSDMALIGLSDNEPKVKGHLEKIFLSANRLRHLITDLLKYSQINAEQVFVRSDLNKIIDEIIADVIMPGQSTVPSVSVEPLPNIDVIPSEMRQVFQNLIVNSLKFCRQNTPCKVTISAELVQEKSFSSAPATDGDYCRINVADNGIGFNHDHAERIFEIFQRLNNRDMYEGNGIGLAIVKKIVERHNGIITATGKENEGATFTIVLPVKHRQTKPSLQQQSKNLKS